MRFIISLILLLTMIPMPVSALEIQAPKVPKAAEEMMPEETASFGAGLLELLRKGLMKIRPDLEDAAQICLSIVAGVMLVSLTKAVSGCASQAADLAGTVIVAAPLLTNMDALIRLGSNTIAELSDYGKLLFPVMTSALAAQGGGATSAVLYTGTVAFDMVLSNMISKFLVPLVHIFLALSLANGALGEEFLKKMRDFVKWFVSWCLKTVITVFTTYMSITGVVSGTTDAAALKAAKVTISSVVPVVGGILSDASEAVLVSAGLMKNAAGIYGILAILAVFLNPFLTMGTHYLAIKATAAISSLFGTKRMTDMIEDFSAAMGLLLAMTGTVCLLLLINTICFLKGVS